MGGIKYLNNLFCKRCCAWVGRDDVVVEGWRYEVL
jgi:hypothetical protein